MILDQFYAVPELLEKLKLMDEKLMNESIPFYAAAEELYRAYRAYTSDGRV